jgi:hypothetical protein
MPLELIICWLSCSVPTALQVHGEEGGLCKQDGYWRVFRDGAAQRNTANCPLRRHMSFAKINPDISNGL